MVALLNTSRATFVSLTRIVSRPAALTVRLLNCGHGVVANTAAPPLIVRLKGDAGKPNELDNGVFVPA